MKRLRLYILIGLLFIGGLICALMPHLAKDIAWALVMLNGKPDLYQSVPQIENWLNWGGSLCVVLAIMIAIRQITRRS